MWDVGKPDDVNTDTGKFQDRSRLIGHVRSCQAAQSKEERKRGRTACPDKRGRPKNPLCGSPLSGRSATTAAGSHGPVRRTTLSPHRKDTDRQLTGLRNVHHWIEHQKLYLGPRFLCTFVHHSLQETDAKFGRGAPSDTPWLSRAESQSGRTETEGKGGVSANETHTNEESMKNYVG